MILTKTVYSIAQEESVASTTHSNCSSSSQRITAVETVLHQSEIREINSQRNHVLALQVISNNCIILLKHTPRTVFQNCQILYY